MNSKTIYASDNCGFISRPSVEKVNLATISKKQNQTIIFKNPVVVVGRMSVVGEKESKGPMGSYFQKSCSDDKMGEKNFERAEYDFLKTAILGAIENANLSPRDIDVMLSGDLLNQITSSSYVARDLNIPYLGLYGACSTMCESLALGASLISSGYYSNAVCATVSHFATAERQFRYPLEYGCQRPPYAQWTTTASGATVISSNGDGIKIKSATIGRVVDYAINDLNNMGAAMAPAAASSIESLFKETCTKASDYDLILTGDLGKLGSDILRDLLKERGFELGQNYIDCGCLMFDSTQKCYQGASGCGCSASILNSFVFQQMKENKYNRVALFATGALMSSQSCFQGETIPGISHGIVFER